MSPSALSWRSGGLPWVGAVVLSVMGGWLSARAEVYTIRTPAGDIRISLSHVSPSGTLVQPAEPDVPAFRPPSIFSAPLPSGSGARALGLAGAFTAIADDATAASWNPAGLIQLERPEASIVYRFSRERQEHHSGADSFDVGDNSFGNANLNYLSAALPFRLWNRNFVAAVNYQEAYDFAQRFTATSKDEARPSTVRETASEVNEATQVDRAKGENSEVTVTSYLKTRKTSALTQILSSELLTGIDFEQEGIIDAVTPALAFEITPSFSLGLALNVYQDSPIGSKSIRSTTRAEYSGETDSRVSIEDEYYTTATYEYNGYIVRPPPPIEVIIPVSGSGEYEPFSDSSSRRSGSRMLVEGLYEEKNEFDDLRGWNATFGGRWTVSRQLSLGATLDLPWTAKAQQTKTIRQSQTLYSRDRSRMLSQSQTETRQQKDVEFRFPLYWAVGGVWRWTDKFYTSLDVSQTRWSDFSFQADGEEKINPLDGSPYGENNVDDTWAVRGGMEYLLVFPSTEIPLRGGMAWEQRPAIGDPDEFWSFSLGTGFSLFKDPGRVIFDIAYIHTRGDNVLGTLVPGQDGLSTDVRKHEVYVSCIKHF